MTTDSDKKHLLSEDLHELSNLLMELRIILERIAAKYVGKDADTTIALETLQYSFTTFQKIARASVELIDLER